ncbi:MAG: radical SAM protein [Clostridiales bacterium]|jgi:hypothetical protein|nr:radical SAM protein [Clostridiales bacterium]
MSYRFDLSNLGVMVDMAGCPNRCRHCWLGSHRNGHLSVSAFRNISEQFRNWRDENGMAIKELGFFSWWREPDYRSDYKELWRLEQELSSPGCAQRFELLSTWRLAHDKDYANWAAALEPKACQVTFFGMEDNTDWGMRRNGAFMDQLTATERCLSAGIVPRWQLFITKRCLNELDEFLRLIYDLNLFKRCKKIGRKFEVFIGGIAPEGNGYEIDGLRPDESDLNLIPKELLAVSREGLAMLGQSESKLLKELAESDTPPNIYVNSPCLAINADYDVYPNIAEPTEWWRLGNLKTDGIDRILKRYRDEATPGMSINRTLPTSVLAKTYGDPNSKKLYDKSDLITRFMHQWGVDYMKGKVI